MNRCYALDPVCPLQRGQPLGDLRIADGFDAVTGARADARPLSYFSNRSISAIASAR